MRPGALHLSARRCQSHPAPGSGQGPPASPRPAKGLRQGRKAALNFSKLQEQKPLSESSPVCGRGSPGVLLLRQVELGRQRRGNGLCPPWVRPRWAPLLSGKPSERDPSRAARTSTDPARSPDRCARAGQKRSRVSAEPCRALPTRVPLGGDPGRSRPVTQGAGGLLPCAHPAGSQPPGVCSPGPAPGPLEGQLSLPPSGGRGADGRAWSSRRAGTHKINRLPARRREPPALTLSQQAPSSTNSRQNSYSRESAPLPVPGARVRGPVRHAQGGGKRGGGGAHRPLRAWALRHNSRGVGTVPLSREPRAAGRWAER